jgi:5'-nucleotidase
VSDQSSGALNGGAPRPLAALAALILSGVVTLAAIGATPKFLVTISVVGTNDLHGRVFPTDGRGGLALLGGYLNALRAARAADHGAVILLDAGDTFQGGIESNLSEGGLVVDAYNALGYSAAAIGNHEFDFGPLDTPAHREAVDPRGALKAIAARSRYPVLAANLIDNATGRHVDWANVSPSTIVHAAGVRVGIIGAMTIEALRSTLSVNVNGLSLAPLADTVSAEAARLRAHGADVVLLTAHAGGSCSDFSDPSDLSSCDSSAEIFRLVRDLPPGTLDGIVAGHIHSALAHIVEGVPIIESYWGGRAFGRMDLIVDRQTRRVVNVRVFPPQDVCAAVVTPDHCAAPDERGAANALYEQRQVEPDPHVLRAMEPALQRVRDRQAEVLSVTIDTPIRRGVDLGAPLGNLFADAMRESVPGADVAVNNNGLGGLRADLPEGPLTFGRLYDVFPFDNRLVQITLSGIELKQVFRDEIRRARPGALAVSGIRVNAACSGNDLDVQLARASGATIGDGDHVIVVTTDMLASGTVFSSVAGPRVVVPPTAPLAREVVADWLRRRGGHLSESQFADGNLRRWNYPPEIARSCATR